MIFYNAGKGLFCGFEEHRPNALPKPSMPNAVIGARDSNRQLEATRVYLVLRLTSVLAGCHDILNKYMVVTVVLL